MKKTGGREKGHDAGGGGRVRVVSRSGFLITLFVYLFLGGLLGYAPFSGPFSAQQWEGELNFVTMKQLCPEKGKAPTELGNMMTRKMGQRQ